MPAGPNAGGSSARKRTVIRQIQGRTNTIAKTFDRVCGVLSGYGYLETPDKHLRAVHQPGRAAPAAG